MFKTLSPTRTRELLEKLGHFPRKSLGQNFLVEGNIVRKSLALAELVPGRAVVEVGPGLGTLSGALLDAGVRLWAVEQDRRMAEHLRESLAPRFPEQFHLLEGDALKHPLADLPEAESAAGFTIAANLPYAVATPWMDAVLAGPLPDRMVLMLQKEAADRYAASHGSKSFGAISIFLQAAFVVTGRHPVSRTCFLPPPKVDSVLLRLDRRPGPVRFPAPVRETVRRIFTQRRKQLGALCRREDDPTLVRWLEGLADHGLPPTVRPEDVPLDRWLALATAGAGGDGC